ncbi:DUF6542 domain-containing protein [Nocardia callitridis]|uniref:DUF6542 domain-containing protein n=1 Tax=Nocardia callitridis TaxID=648753 RepID=A0ABP9JRY6_9NOCA
MAASQRLQSRVPAPQRSIVPTVPGLPVAAAVSIAVVCTILGFSIDLLGGGSDLTGAFATLYVLGCVVAVCVVRYRGLFSTLVLPPLLLFLAVPLAYEWLTGHTSTSIKDILLNLAIPLVNRFPVMMLATMLVLLVGGIRVLMERREKAAAEQSGRPRRSETLSRAAAKRKPERTLGPTKPTSASAARRRPRRSAKESDDFDQDETPARTGRRAAAKVADAPPRVATPARAREGTRTPTRSGSRPPAGAMPRGEGRPPTGAMPRGEGRPPAGAKPRGDGRQPTGAMPRGEGRPPAGAMPRGEGRPPAAARPRADGRQPTGAMPRGEAPRRRNDPPHPQPNVRYRDRDSGRGDRRRPENL